MSLETKKLVSVLATSTLVTETREEMVETAEAVEFAEVSKDGAESKGSEINAIYPTLARMLRLPIRLTDVGAQKIDGTMLDTFGMIVTAFSVTNKANRVKFFEEIFLVANISLEVVLEMPFLTLGSVDVDFLVWKLCWRIYTIKEAFPTPRHVELVDKKEFAAVALDLESETFIVHVTSLSSDALSSSSPLNFDVHPFCRPQVSSLIGEKAPTKVFAEYLDFADVFSPDLAFKLPEYTGINDHAIELVDG